MEQGQGEEVAKQRRKKKKCDLGAIFSLFKPNVKRPSGCLRPKSDRMHSIIPMARCSSRGGLGGFISSSLLACV